MDKQTNNDMPINLDQEKLVKEHPELELSLNWPQDMVTTLVPQSLRDPSGLSISPDILLGNDKSDRAINIMIVNPSENYNEVDARESFTFHESIDNMGDFFSNPSDAKQPLLYAQLNKLSGQPETVVLETLDINSSFHGQGLGSDFMKKLRLLAKQFGFEQIVCTAANQRVVKFNKKNNFSLLRGGDVYKAFKKAGYWEPGDSSTPMQLKL